MKPDGNYHPPKSWVKFEDLKPGTTFHEIIQGQPVEFIKLNTDDTVWVAVNLTTGELVHFDYDDFVYPVNTGWLTELQCYGVKIPDEIKAKGHKAIITHIFNECEYRKADDAWREEVTKYFPSLGMMSWSGPHRTIPWMLKQIFEADERERAEIQQRMEEQKRIRKDEQEKYRKEWDERQEKNEPKHWRS